MNATWKISLTSEHWGRICATDDAAAAEIVRQQPALAAELGLSLETPPPPPPVVHRRQVESTAPPETTPVETPPAESTSPPEGPKSRPAKSK